MKRIRKICLSILSLCLLFLASACGAKSGGAAASYERQYTSMNSRAAEAQLMRYDADELRPAEPERVNETAEGSPLAAGAATQTRKLVKRAELRIRVEDPGATEQPLASLIEKYRAWPASQAIYENSRDYTIMVPSYSYEAMLADLAGLGKILRRTESAEDVTLRYYDLESRLATKRELLKTYQGYLGKAKNIEEILSVESRIADLQQEIDWTGTQLRNLSGIIDYSTINVEIIGPVNAVSYSKPTLAEKLGELFGSFADVASGALVVLTGIIIYGIPALLIVIFLFWIFFGRIGLIKKLWRLAARK